jgi:hypothetical protein
MPLKSTNLFAQIIDLADRDAFRSIVRKHGGDRCAKGFTCWDQAVSMLFCQLGKAQSLREICGGLDSCMGKLNHLGLHESPRRTTLAYANEHRSWKIYEADILTKSEEVKRRTLKQGKHYNLKHKGEESQPQQTLKPSIVSDQKVSGTF